MILLERVSKARKAKEKADAAFVAAVCEAKSVHSWAELSGATGLSKAGVRYLVTTSKEGGRDA